MAEEEAEEEEEVVRVAELRVEEVVGEEVVVNLFHRILCFFRNGNQCRKAN